MSTYKYIEVTDRDGVRWIVFNRPEKLNSFNRGLMDEVIKALKESGYWAVVFTGKGKFFSAGIDLAELANSKDVLESSSVFEKLAEMVNTILMLDVPIIIAMNGSAYGGGAEFLWLGDFVVAPKGIKIGWPEARWGLVPPLLPTMGKYTLGLMRSQYLAYTSGTITSEAAYEHGLISILVNSIDDLEKAVNDILQSLRGNSPEAFKSLKNYFRKIKMDVLVMYGVSELIRLSRDRGVIERAKAFVDRREFPSYEWG